MHAGKILVSQYKWWWYSIVNISFQDISKLGINAKRVKYISMS